VCCRFQRGLGANLGTCRNVAALPKRQTQESKSQTSQQAAAGEVAGKKDDGERAGNKDKNEELTTATLESTAARLITILQQEEEGEKEPEPAAAAEGGGGGETEATEDKDTSADTSADLGTDAADKAAEKETEAAEAASKWAAMGSVVTWNLRSKLHLCFVCSPLFLTLAPSSPSSILSLFLVLHCVFCLERLSPLADTSDIQISTTSAVEDFLSGAQHWCLQPTVTCPWRPSSRRQQPWRISRPRISKMRWVPG
jgi:hypothetical protein